MPNWCFTSYVLEGDEREIKQLDKILTNLSKRKTPKVKSDFKQHWLGCLVHELGGDWHNIYCRGSWDDKERIGNTLKICTETAWGPMNEVFDFICQKFPSLKYYYASEEDGMEEYYTNDIEGKYFPDRYHIDLCDPDGNYDSDYFKTFEELLCWLNSNYNPSTPLRTEEDIDNLDDEWREENNDAFINLHHIVVCDQ